MSNLPKGSGEPQTRTNDSGSELGLNTVNTVLSEQSVALLESFLYEYWDEFADTGYVEPLMKMLSCYVKHYSDAADTRYIFRPECMIDFVSRIIQINNDLGMILDFSDPYFWVNTDDGWRLPVYDGQECETSETL